MKSSSSKVYSNARTTSIGHYIGKEATTPRL